MHRARIRCRRRTKRRQNIATVFMLAGLVAGVMCAWCFGEQVVGFLDPVPRIVTADLSRTLASSPTVRKTQPLPHKRPVYPYSIIPGGVDSADELKIAMRFDPVVAAHYADFDLPNTRVERVTVRKAVFVSFRSGNRVAWTSRRLTLQPGETILTDGRNSARTRCGNRITDMPPTALAPEEPAPEVFDEAVPLDTVSFDLRDGYDTLVGLGELPAPSVTGDGAPSALPALLPPDLDLPEPNMLQFPPLFWNPPTVNPETPPEEPQTPEPTPVPEPGTFLLVSPALGIYASLRRSHRPCWAHGPGRADPSPRFLACPRSDGQVPP